MSKYFKLINLIYPNRYERLYFLLLLIRAIESGKRCRESRMRIRPVRERAHCRDAGPKSRSKSRYKNINNYFACKIYCFKILNTFKISKFI